MSLQCFDLTGESNFDERNAQLIRGSFLKKQILKKSILTLGTHYTPMYSKVFAENRYAMLPYFYAQLANFFMSKNKTCP